MDTLHLSYMLEPRSAAAWLLTGEGLPTKVAVGSLDCPTAVMLDIATRPLKGRAYTKAVRIIGGAIAIPGHFATTSNDSSYTSAGGDFAFQGSRETEPSATTNEPDRKALPDDMETTTWTVRTPRGHFLFVMPEPDGIDRGKAATGVLAFLQGRLHGACAISRVDAGQFTTMPTFASREMNLILADE